MASETKNAKLLLEDLFELEKRLGPLRLADSANECRDRQIREILHRCDLLMCTAATKFRAIAYMDRVLDRASVRFHSSALPLLNGAVIALAARYEQQQLDLVALKQVLQPISSDELDGMIWFVQNTLGNALICPTIYTFVQSLFDNFPIRRYPGMPQVARVFAEIGVCEGGVEFARQRPSRVAAAAALCALEYMHVDASAWQHAIQSMGNFKMEHLLQFRAELYDLVSRTIPPPDRVLDEAETQPPAQPAAPQPNGINRAPAEHDNVDAGFVRRPHVVPPEPLSTRQVQDRNLNASPPAQAEERTSTDMDIEHVVGIEFVEDSDTNSGPPQLLRVTMHNVSAIRRPNARPVASEAKMRANDHVPVFQRIRLPEPRSRAS